MRPFRHVRVLQGAMLLLACVWLLPVRSAAAETITVAAAANVKFAFDELIAGFEAGHPDVTVRMTYGASGSIVAQVRNGAPFDLFFSADVEFPRQLARDGLALDDAVFAYAIGRLVVWVPSDAGDALAERGIAILADPAVRTVTIANPRHAPYGVAAVAALRHHGLHETVAPKLVLGENVAQAAQFAQSGAADAAIIALSLALSPGLRQAGRYWVVPAGAHPPVEQAGIILRTTRRAAAARQFRDYVTGGAGRDVLLRHGYTPPD